MKIHDTDPVWFGVPGHRLEEARAKRIANFLSETNERIIDGGYEFFTLPPSAQVTRLTVWFESDEMTPKEACEVLCIIKEERFALSAA